MSSKSKSLGGSVRDKWKLKKWYSILAPKVFGEVSLGSTPAYTPVQALGRKVETTLYDLTGDFSMVYVHLYFKIVANDADRLVTVFNGHELSRDYIRSLVRRKSSKINSITEVTTKDGYSIRLKALALSTYRIHREQRTAIRKIMDDIIRKSSESKTFDELIQDIVFGKLSNDIFNEVKKIAPLRKVEIEKSKLLSLPQLRNS
ncbi:MULTISPECIES: 30S ribosomal protein S3ae [Acidianus]|uniref:Small ribosomal subunit protein eS1 n=1 Tax=Candidatus Acidianus copahuensis TaxID=1160895 RepID=A0A031LN87_9CREN|nr:MULTISPECIES: 30S ribosomal protein S3ae [Acidianus]EZQ03885.1 hypothetical protein CM19_09200 [Candidatus Acidianus copahuensis]NON63003.1 30S ribosomal protein S3ae [Acidianus sp. RZ1]